MKILITGNLGYIGPVVVKWLHRNLNESHLTGLDIGYYKNCITTDAQELREYLPDEQHFGDVRNINPEFLEGFDAIVHLAAISNDPMGKMFHDATYEINYRATVNLAKMAKQAGVKSFVFASSCSVYGFSETGARTEDSEVNPLTTYAESKILSEQYLETIAGENFTVTALRFSTAAGMSCRLRLDLVLNDFVFAAVNHGVIKILSDGTPWRPIIDVKDMARAIEWAVNRKYTNGGNFVAVNVGSNNSNYQVIDLARAVAEIIPGTSIDINKDASPDKRSYKVNFDLFKSLAPDHQNQVSLQQTILELKEGIEKFNFNGKNKIAADLIRLNVLQNLLNSNKIDLGLHWI